MRKWYLLTAGSVLTWREAVGCSSPRGERTHTPRSWMWFMRLQQRVLAASKAGRDRQPWTQELFADTRLGGAVVLSMFHWNFVCLSRLDPGQSIDEEWSGNSGRAALCLPYPPLSSKSQSCLCPGWLLDGKAVSFWWIAGARRTVSFLVSGAEFVTFPHQRPLQKRAGHFHQSRGFSLRWK